MKKQSLLILLFACSFLFQSCSIVFGTLSRRAIPAFAIAAADLHGRGSSYDPVGINAGVIVPVAQLNESTSFRPELNISMQGAKYTDYNVSGTVHLLYANFPMMLRYQNNSGFFGEAGVQPGFLLRAKDRFNGNTLDYGNEVNKFDFGIPVGVGYEFKNNLGLGFRVIQGLTNVDGNNTTKTHNFVMALRFTYRFDKK